MRKLYSPFRVSLSPGDVSILVIALTVLVAGLLWFVASASHTFTSEVPARGGSYTEAVVGTPRFINPVLAVSDVDRDLTALMFSGLMRATPDNTLVPDLADSFTLSEDRTTYTFTLKESARFHDGTSVTAEDVAFTIALAQNPLLKSSKRANWEGVEVTVVDTRTISFTLREPYPLFLENVRLGILPKHLWDSVTAEEVPFSKLNIEPVGSGPFAFSKLVINSGGIPTSLHLVGFAEGARTPYLTSLALHFFSNEDEQLEALEGDETLAAYSVLAEGRVPHEAVLGRVFAVFFNQNQQNLFADKAVRDALDAALDKEVIVSTLIDGYGSPLSGPLPPTTLSTEPQGSRVQEAAAILERAGWKKSEDGIWQKTVKKVTTRLAFTLRTGSAPELTEAGELVRDTWRAFGVDVTLEIFDVSDLQQDVIRPRKYDALLFGQVVGSNADLFAFWDSSQRNDPGLNIGLYTSSKVDTLLRDARRADESERQTLTKEAADTISGEVAAVFLYSPHFVFGTPPSIRGVQLGNIVTPADRFLSVAEWYVHTERVWPFFK